MQTYKIFLALVTILFLGDPSSSSNAVAAPRWNPYQMIWGHPYLGVVVRDVPRRFRARFHLRAHEGVWVAQVESDSPADTAGIVEGDIILKIEGRTIWGSMDFVRKIRRHRPGDEISLDILENGQPWKTRVQLASAPPGWEFRFSFPNWNFVEKAWLGIKLQALDQDLAHYFGVKPSDGVLIVSVKPHSPAARAGFKSGDILVKMDGRPVKTTRDVEEILEGFAPGEKITIVILRQGRKIQKEVRLGRVPQKERLNLFRFVWPRLYTRPRFWDYPRAWWYFQKETIGRKFIFWRNRILFQTTQIQWKIQKQVHKWRAWLTDRLAHEFQKTTHSKTHSRCAAA